jgi:sugar phosphate isomerase/epimerase
MTTRRKFVQQSAVLSIGALALLRCKTAQITGSNNIGLQLYTVRDAMTADAKGTLTALAKMGYTDVEGAGYGNGKMYGMAPKDFKMLLNDLGLRMNSMHTMLGTHVPNQERTLINKPELLMEDCNILGLSYLICPYLFDHERKTMDQYKKLTDSFNKLGELSSKYKIQFGYHNHDFEFMTVDGQIPYDYMLQNTDPKNVTFELDLYWVKKAGKDTFEYFSKHRNRFELWHVKDMDNTPEQFFTEVGNGVIDFKSIFTKKKESGMKLFYVEQDSCKNHLPIESVKISIDNLKSKILS